MGPFLLPFGIHGSIEFGKQIGIYAPVSRKLATPFGYLLDVQFAVVETPSDQVMDCLWEKVPEILPYH